MVARILHLIAEKNEGLVEGLCRLADLTKPEAQKLIELGAVFVNKKRLRSRDFRLTPGDYLRIHREPRRFPSKQVPWLQHIVHETSELLVINKVSGIPTHPGLDNYQECCLTELAELFEQELYITHRLDLPTQGLLVFAKSREAQTQFNELIQEGVLQKKYRALCLAPGPPPQLLRHWMEPSKRAPRQVYDEQDSGGRRKLCELQIISRQLSPCGSFVELEIELLTGRTHQIRTQLAKMGSPIINDLEYGGRSTDTDASNRLTPGAWIALQACALKAPAKGKLDALELELPRPELWESFGLGSRSEHLATRHSWSH